jgi:hypothetical protein
VKEFVGEIGTRRLGAGRRLSLQVFNSERDATGFAQMTRGANCRAARES